MDKKYQKVLNNSSLSLCELISSKIEEIIEKYHCSLHFRDCLGFVIVTHQTMYQLLYPYNSHMSPLCSWFGKETNRVLCNQSKEKLACVMHKHKKPFYGSCYLGLEQFHFPILLFGKVVGMIFIGMYSKNPTESLKKLERSCQKCQINYSKCEDLFYQTISNIDYDVSEMEHDVQQLCSHIALLYANELQSSPEAHNYFLHDANPKESILKRATTYIKNNYRNDLSLQKIAKACYCNPNYLSNVFMKYYDISIIDYILAIRLKKAKEYLSMTSMSVKEVAMETGFNYPNYFSYIFKKNTGETPLQYRRKIKEG